MQKVPFTQPNTLCSAGAVLAAPSCRRLEVYLPEAAKWEADERPWHLAADVGQPNGCRWPAERLGLLKAAGIGPAAIQQQ